MSQQASLCAATRESQFTAMKHPCSQNINNNNNNKKEPIKNKTKPKSLKCLELIIELSRFSRFKINTKKKIMLTTNARNEQLELKIKAHYSL